MVSKYNLKHLQRTYRFRLYPNPEHSKKLQTNLAVCRWVYNKMVEHSKNKHISRNDLNYFLTELKQQEPWLYKYHSKMLQMISTQIDSAQKALKQLHENGHRARSLKFAKYSEYRTFTYNQSGFKIEDSFLYLSMIGKTKIIQHRPIPENAQVKQVMVTKSKSGKWYACVTCDMDNVIQVPRIDFKKAVGIDVGIKNLAYDSDGFATPNPLFLKKLLKPLVRSQRKISRRQKGSNNRKKAVRFYQIIHERIKNRRKDFLHILSTHYAKNHNIVFVERLQKLNMVKNHRLARSILDSGWGTFTNMLDYKCMLVEVPAKNTTVECSRCGNMVPKSLAVRIHRCDVCGLVLDRDHNSAIDILKKGLKIFGLSPQATVSLPQELREVTPVEIPKGSMKQEAHML